MAKSKKSTPEPALNYEAKLWQVADALRNNKDAAEYEHVVGGSTSNRALLGARFP